MNLAFKIATRFLAKSKGQTALISLGIGIGIAVLIFIGSLIEGLQIDLLDSTIGNSSHITISNREKSESVESYGDIEEVLEEESRITEVSPNISSGAFISFEDEFIQVLFRGFDFERAEGIYAFEDALTEGSKMPSGDEVLLGLAIAEENGIEIGDTVKVTAPEAESTELKVSGFIDLKVAALNESWVVGDIEKSKAIFGFRADEVSSVEMQVEEPFSADTIALELESEIARDDLRYRDWKASNEQLLSGLSGQSTSSLMIQVFVIISVVLGIASVLAITVMQKSRQIGILKAMGIKDSTASLVFLMQGFILGIFGGILGIAFGIGLLFVFTKFALNPDGTPVVPIYIDPLFIAVSGLVAVVSATIASVIPAIKSKNLSPIEVIRNG